MNVTTPSSLLLLALLSASGAVLADDAAILKCRALAETQARLACYDTIPVGVRQAAAAPVAAVAPSASPEQRFGLEQAARKEAEPQSVDSSIVGDFDGWSPGAQIRLANGQVWRVIDGSSASLARMTNPKVRVARNLFGTIFLEIEGTNNSPKVRRVR